MDVWSSKIAGIVDGHVHMQALDDQESLLQIRQATGIDKMALVAIQNPASGEGLCSALYMKARHPEWIFVFAGLNHAQALSKGRVKTPTLVEQVERFVALGCDGIKMIEGKPTFRQRLNVPVTDPYYADYWAKVEELSLPIVWHVNDPEEFWDPDLLPAWAKERNWGYGPDDVQKEQLYGEVEEVLQRHPGVKVTFAHFCFLSADLDRAACFLDQHPNVCFDLAPGVEMLYNMSHDPDRSRDFFLKYADRIVFGTDLFSGLTEDQGRYRSGLVFRWLESEDTFRVHPEADFLLGAPQDGVVKGMGLPDEVLHQIYGANHRRMVTAVPRRLDVGLAVEECYRLADLATEMSGKGAKETEAGRVAHLLAEEQAGDGSL